jgi:pilus assembly protein CpaC
LKNFLRGLLLLLAVFALPVQAADDQPIVLSVDRSETINLPEPADTVFIASPDIADVQVISPSVITVYGRKAGETSLVASKKDGSILLKRKIVVDTDLGKLQGVLGTMLPRIKALPVPGGIVLEGEAKSSSEAADAQRVAKKFLGNDRDEVINRLKVSGNEQIQLRVRVAEVSKNVNKVFGINWESLLTMGSGIGIGLVSGADIINSDTPGQITRSPANNSVYAGYNSGGFQINGLIDALAEDGLLTLMAEPNLIAKSGETATFLAGGEFPIPVPQQNGAITIEFKPYGVSLAFTPTIVGKNRISIQVRPEVSELTSTGSITLNGITVPALLSRRAETTVELGSGQTFAIGGLIRSYQNNDIRKFPILGDIPILGALFRSTAFRNNQSELVILVTPYLVKPSNEPLATPVDGYAPANDLDRAFLQETFSDGIPNVPDRVGETLQGPVGLMGE